MKVSNNLKSKLSAAVLVSVALGLTCTSAVAATATAPFNVTATVVATCLISATDLAFGPYSGVVADATTTISVTCSNLKTYDIGLSAGAGAAVTTRHMTGPGADVLNYGLFQDAAHTINWGNSVGTDAVHGTGSGLAQSITVNGHVPAGQYVLAGAYTDTITATITY